ncbi:MAG TPA: alkaline phosphatase family protein [Gaiellaceae bacterium]|nr:alkaline phosphatase family protein [Gaiellaceae bacterium]
MRGRCVLVGVVLIAAAIAASVSASAPTPLCGSRSTVAPARVRHVVWVFMENKTADAVVHSHSTPYIASLATRCGLATNYHNITHPSLPNYLAATSGGTHGVTSDCQPSHCAQSGGSIFAQVDAAHLTWRSYVESMPSSCDQQNASPYATKHNPAAYYTALRAACAKDDVPLEGSDNGLLHDLSADTLPTFSLIVPNSCDDMHSCPPKAGDAWLSSWIPRITATASYLSGQTVVFITWDEGDVHTPTATAGESCPANATDPSCHVAMLVLSAGTPRGARDSQPYDHYSLLKTTEQLLQLRGRLGHAAASQTRSMVTAFHL